MNKPMQGLADYLRAQADALESFDTSIADASLSRLALRQWASEVDAAPLRETAGTPEAAVPGIPAGWQSIESAPKDGTYLLLMVETHLRPQPMPFTGRWFHGSSGCWVIVNADLAIQRVDPTHWMPLPPPPVAAAPAAPEARKGVMWPQNGGADSPMSPTLPAQAKDGP